MTSEHLEFPPQWKQHEGILYQRYGEPKPSSKLAMFDMDSTLMMTPSTLVNDLVKGLKPSIGKPAIPNDFVLYNPNVKQKLQEELDSGRAIVVCSNQSQLFDDPRMSKLIFARIQLLLQELNIPLYILLAFRRDLCRKPAPGMLTFYEKSLNCGMEVDRGNTFYVGDAAGRLWTEALLEANCKRVLNLLKAVDYSDKKYMCRGKDGKPEPANAVDIIAKLKASHLRSKFMRDFSDCDHKFALNNRIGFYTPEDYFCKLPSMTLTIDFEPKKVGAYPASQDELKTRDKCMCVARESLEARNNVVIDNTNPTAEARRGYIELAKEIGVRCTLVFLDVSKDFSLHFNRFRKLVEQPDHKAVPQVAIHSYFSKMEVPMEDEGYHRLIKITDDTFPVKHTEISEMYLP
ncbi:bifunctional polynucleotide phosphatase/kinase like protein [Babesia gibsoni]|uniref:Bifunctional polynucleotide phosphatase/kinase like protein n=1 Tax=Babesia gibsoni TaxID=33632 RepID=A0AAD8PF47_BABGI|nr:bifunctional polynucleotide phosphatase/kinase like protein [Babesia gibsoni]